MRPTPPPYQNRPAWPISPVVRRILPAALALLALVEISSPRAQSAARDVRPPGLFYSLQHPTYPPFPANPFPDLPVYWIEADRFVYDDRTVDYDQR